MRNGGAVMRKVKELKKSLPLAAVFARLYQEEDAVFLDSSLKNNLEGIPSSVGILI